MMQRITILGATGSIGVSTLQVLALHPERYSVYALTAHSSVDVLAAQCEQFRPQRAVVGTADAALALQHLLTQKGLQIQIDYGTDALCEVASAAECDTVMAAIVGAAGLAPTLAAANAGKKILLANKEALVMSGQLFMDAVSKNGAMLLPIDSEHNAIFQCLPSITQQHQQYQQYQQYQQPQQPCHQGVAKIILTASGGPFLKRSVNTLDAVTPEEAVTHPNWSMGRKISVDSATMMNKGLEVIEAHYLFDVAVDQIEVLIHPQSVIHSMVSYVDGSVIAQLGQPDMRTPIAHALAFPERIASGVVPLDLAEIAQLNFERPDFERFPCLKLAYQALQTGGTAPAILNAANEVAVEAFLNREIGFRVIDQLIARVMDKLPSTSMSNLENLFVQDKAARDLARACLQS